MIELTFSAGRPLVDECFENKVSMPFSYKILKQRLTLEFGSFHSFWPNAMKNRTTPSEKRSAFNGL
jgi:hypothetical protein